jgi:hypothetical protein
MDQLEKRDAMISYNLGSISCFGEHFGAAAEQELPGKA